MTQWAATCAERRPRSHSTCSHIRRSHLGRVGATLCIWDGSAICMRPVRRSSPTRARTVQLSWVPSVRLPLSLTKRPWSTLPAKVGSHPCDCPLGRLRVRCRWFLCWSCSWRRCSCGRCTGPLDLSVPARVAPDALRAALISAHEQKQQLQRRHDIMAHNLKISLHTSPRRIHTSSPLSRVHPAPRASLRARCASGSVAGGGTRACLDASR